MHINNFDEIENEDNIHLNNNFHQNSFVWKDIQYSIDNKSGTK